ncbi:hypothetical protein HN51_070276 [Arachis hypogaea]
MCNIYNNLINKNFKAPASTAMISFLNYKTLDGTIKEDITISSVPFKLPLILSLELARLYLR